ncbi:MAG TPA: amino acid permease [Planctomycetia bacterium]|nr:amino acid permease [Planctomycetia bacterium]
MSGPDPRGGALDLPRTFGFWTGAAIVAASMIGSGILVSPGHTAAATGSHMLATLLWAGCGLLALCGALTLAEMATARPQVGGEVIFVEWAFGRFAGFIYGWATLVLGFIGPIAVIARLAADYTIKSLPEVYAGSLGGADCNCVSWLAVTYIAIFTLTLCLGQKESAWVQTAATAVKYGTLAAIALAGLVFGLPHAERLFVSVPPEQGWTGILTATFYIKYTYIGWNGVTYVAGEIRDPSRLLPRCIIAGCLGTTALYLTVVLAMGLAYSPADVQAIPENERDLLAIRAFEKLSGVPAAGRVFAAVVGLGMLATINAFLLTGSRVAFMMARKGGLPSFLGHWSGRNAPVTALLLQGAAAAALAWNATAASLMYELGIGLSLMGVLFGGAIFALRRRPEYRPTFRVPLYPLPSIIYFGICLSLVGFAATMKTEFFLKAAGAIVAGAPLYFLTRRPAAATDDRAATP